MRLQDVILKYWCRLEPPRSLWEPCQDPPRILNQHVQGWIWAPGLCQNSPGDATVQPRLTTTSLVKTKKVSNVTLKNYTSVQVMGILGSPVFSSRRLSVTNTCVRSCTIGLGAADPERMSTLGSYELSTNHVSAVTPWVPDQTDASLFHRFEMELIIPTSWDYCENKFHNHSKAARTIRAYRGCWMHLGPLVLLSFTSKTPCYLRYKTKDEKAQFDRY
ncbi:uncharacterized protein LOC122238095 [Panthera tigris]|uniref:uncharacterized protein LOC122238095 n=1 Tax=Panthera tigris TaxID=9694 RepID=UPI001C6FC0C4|nr:uncharacterized protein LOC122238095 [Panthera tigris]